MQSDSPFTWRNFINIQLTTLGTTPFWYPSFGLHMIKKSEVLLSKTPGCLSHTNFFQSFKDIPHLYRGYRMILAYQPLYPFIIATQQKFIKESNSLFHNIALSASITGLGAFIANPVEVCILKMQKNESNISYYQLLRKLINDEGAQRLFRGATSFAVRGATFGTSLMVTQPYISKIINSDNNNDVLPSLASSVISSAIGNVVAIPADLTSVMKQSPNYKNMSAIECLTEVHKKFGIKGFTVGFGHKVVATAIEIFLFTQGYAYLNQSSH